MIIVTNSDSGIRSDVNRCVTTCCSHSNATEKWCQRSSLNKQLNGYGMLWYGMKHKYNIENEYKN
jgi:hypothetical protein